MMHEGRFDVVIGAGPRVEPWPTIGVRVLSALCSDMGLTVGVFGGESLKVLGMLPKPSTGSFVLVEDAQNRMHRIHARAVVRVSAWPSLPDPFPGWRSQGLVPITTAEKLFDQKSVTWAPSTAILGTGNRALRFGSSLLEAGVPAVLAIESFTQWGGKRTAAWEVERRRFEMLGGRILEATPVSLLPKSALFWELRLKDLHGVRIHNVARVVSAGPFRDLREIREYPSGSGLYEFVQQSSEGLESDVDGWMLEEELGRWLAVKLIRALKRDFDSHAQKVEFEKIAHRTRLRLKRYKRHRELPWAPSYQGKWMNAEDMKQLRTFVGVPQTAHQQKLVASIECVESISCNVCQKACPDGAIEKGRTLIEDKCTGCGICVEVCPAGAIALMQERAEKTTSLLVFPSQKTGPFNPGEQVNVLNRKGDVLAQGRIVRESPRAGLPDSLVSVEVAPHLLWEARAARKLKTGPEDRAFIESQERERQHSEKVEIVLSGEKRFVRPGISVGTALFEVGKARADDVLHCSDGTCGLCSVYIDGVKKLACKTKVRKGMNVELRKTRVEPENQGDLCACLKVSHAKVLERMHQGKLRSPEAVIAVTHVGEGKCKGAFCADAFRRLLIEAMPDSDLTQWVDWRFPWSEWSPGRN